MRVEQQYFYFQEWREATIAKMENLSDPLPATSEDRSVSFRGAVSPIIICNPKCALAAAPRT